MKIYDVDFWMYSGRMDDYDNHREKVEAISKTHAKKIINNKYPRAKNINAQLSTQ